MGFFKKRPWAGLLLGAVVLGLFLAASIVYGVREISLGAAYDAIVRFDGSADHVIIRTVRIPRALIAAGVGSALAVSGALMQALTGNPLASPGILGVNAGAALFVVMALFVWKIESLSAFVWIAFLGAGITGAAVYGLGAMGRSGMTPLKLTVAGAAVTALLASIMQGILVLHERTLDEIRLWLAGSVADRDIDLFLMVLPYMLIGLAGSFILGKAITVLSLGEDVAKGLGQRTVWVKIAAALLVVMLAGGSVAIAGPIAFIGLAVPHISRGMVGQDYRWVLPYSALLGAVLLIVADLGARFVIKPEEVPVGVMTALIGAPFFIYLARWGVKKA